MSATLVIPADVLQRIQCAYNARKAASSAGVTLLAFLQVNEANARIAQELFSLLDQLSEVKNAGSASAS